MRVKQRLKIWNIDTFTVFFYGVFDKIIYIIQPHLFYLKTQDYKVYLLQKAF